MAYPLEAGEGGVKLRPELMEAERLYHCVFGGKVILAYRDAQEVLHCYEVEEPELVGLVRGCAGRDEAERALEEYAARLRPNE